MHPGVIEPHDRGLDADATPGRLVRLLRGWRLLRGERVRDAEVACPIGIEVHVDVADRGRGDVDRDRSLAEERRPRRLERADANAHAIDVDHLHALGIVHAGADATGATEAERCNVVDLDRACEVGLEDAVHLRRDEPSRRRQVQMHDCCTRGRRDEHDAHAHDGANHTKDPSCAVALELRSHQYASPMPRETAIGMPSGNVSGRRSSGGRPPMTCIPGIR